MTLLPFDDRDGWLWLDGRLLPWRDARAHVLSHGLHYASAVFEGERAYGGTIFRLRDHTNRLLASARMMDFPLPWTAEEIDAACDAVVAANGLSDAYVRPVAWRGAEALGVSGAGGRPHLAIAAWEWGDYYGDRMAGIALSESRWRRPPPDTAPVMVKASCLYAIGTLAKRQAEAEGRDDALMLDWRGLVSETTSANVFLAIDGTLHTPAPDCFLDGLTRQMVVRLAKLAQIPVVERAIQPADLDRATEVLLTGTAAEVTAVRRIGAREYAPGDITARLMRDFDALKRRPAAEVALLVG
jgi:branched-chain amino acid aminotransferase